MTLLLVAVVPCAMAQDQAAGEDQHGGSPSNLGLNLADREDDSEDRLRLHLDEDALRPVSPGEGSSMPQLALTSQSAVEAGAQSPLNGDFLEELRLMRWPDGVGRVGHQVVGEQARMLSGGLKGSFRASGEYVDGSTGVPINLVAVGRAVARWWRERQQRRLPEGSRVQHDAVLQLVVHEADGSAPAEISVLPLTRGWVGEAMPGSCDEHGLCTVDGMPRTTGTLLVRGHGAALAKVEGRDHEAPVQEVKVRLRPTGWLKLEPAEGVRPEVCIRDEATSLKVPVIRWMNPERKECVTLTGAGLPLLLPVASYVVEASTGGEDAVILRVDLVAGEKRLLEIPDSTQE